MIEVYLAEACPYCAKVRRFLEEKAIAYVLKPVPLGHRMNSYKEELLKIGGKAQVPFLVDAEAEVKMYESDAIISYLSHSN